MVISSRHPSTRVRLEGTHLQDLARFATRRGTKVPPSHPPMASQTNPESCRIVELANDRI